MHQRQEIGKLEDPKKFKQPKEIQQLYSSKIHKFGSFKMCTLKHVTSYRFIYRNDYFVQILFDLQIR